MHTLFYSLLLFLPSAVWLQYWHVRKHLREKEKLVIEHDKKHNCVVTFCPGTRTGYGSPTAVMKTSIDDIQACFFPLIYFINTAEKTIDIAVMNINIKEIFTALMLKLNEGVVVRIMLDLSHSVLTPLMALRKKGAKILLYNQTNSIMHYKFAVKDSCYMVTGSMNWSDLSTYYKYDHYVFTSVKHVVKSYEDAFQETWEMIENRNEHYKC